MADEDDDNVRWYRRIMAMFPSDIRRRAEPPAPPRGRQKLKKYEKLVRLAILDQRIARLRAAELTVPEIARELGKSASVIDRRLAATARAKAAKADRRKRRVRAYLAWRKSRQL